MLFKPVHPFVTMVIPAGNGLFPQDNAHCHTAYIVHKWFEEHEVLNKFKVLPWPPNSPEWDVLDQQFWSMAAPPCNLQDLMDLLLMFWYQTQQDTRARWTHICEHSIKSAMAKMQTVWNDPVANNCNVARSITTAGMECERWVGDSLSSLISSSNYNIA